MSEKRPGRPRQRAQGSRRRNPRDAGDVVGESPWGRQNISLIAKAVGLLFFTPSLPPTYPDNASPKTQQPASFLVSSPKSPELAVQLTGGIQQFKPLCYLQGENDAPYRGGSNR
jgi:hypothetical protein